MHDCAHFSTHSCWCSILCTLSDVQPYALSLVFSHVQSRWCSLMCILACPVLRTLAGVAFYALSQVFSNMYSRWCTVMCTLACSILCTLDGVAECGGYCCVGVCAGWLLMHMCWKNSFFMCIFVCSCMSAAVFLSVPCLCACSCICM